MRLLFVSVVSAAAVLVTGAANAADLSPAAIKAPPAAPVHSWTGCYAGAQVGWGWGSPSFSDSTPRNVFSATGANLAGGLFDPQALQRTASIDDSGVLFGAQVGCDYQFSGNLLVGISGSAAGADINGTAIDPYTEAGGLVAPSTGTMTAKTDFLADVSGRLGVIWANEILFYAKGGVAWAHTDYTADTCYCSSDSATAFSANSTTTGALVGGGFEWALAANWSAFAEYNHYFFGSQTVNFTAPGIGFVFTPPLTAAVSVRPSLDVVKVGVNYHFNSGL